ncbi:MULTISPECIES: hypothetical protein [Nonlabens]|uniref:Protease stability complex PrcB-like protein n=1 Tax=Nonlabens xylanidelens TaxID=191564 RepID=A0A2S6IQX4_9FLAO|nr:hypothetical protein [Nonlabens xylanidelens]PPK96639.1 hypothetical protein LY01_00462 [Nonlabens xylanidelens]PQJ13357.1 hypothetical protein BST94_13395 [Nonlabens xylanidelens]
MKKIILFLFVSIVFVSCNSDDDSTSVPITLISENSLHGNGQEGIIEQNRVITDSVTWNNLIASMDSVNMVSDQFTETIIDFNTYTVIAVFDEVRPSSAYDLEVHIFQNTSNIIVDVNNINFGENEFNIVQQPFYIVKIENSNLPIVFQ